MNHMTVCHQMCPNCGSVVDCSDGVFDWFILLVKQEIMNNVLNFMLQPNVSVNVMNKCPRCKKQYNNPWQECDDCITKYYPET